MLAVGNPATYDSAQKSSIFQGRYLEHGLLPVLFVVSNSGSQPVVLEGIRVQLVLRDGGGNELMFFDIPLDNYLAAKP